MTESIDPVTTALTGKLPFYLLLAAALTFPIALTVLRLYARAVRRSMGSRAHSVPTAAPRAVDAPAIDGSQTDARPAVLRDLAEPSASAAADALLARLLAGPRRAAFVYAAAGLGYGVVMAASRLLADGLQFLPVRFLFLAWVFFWPVVPTIGIVAATTRRAKAIVTGLYFLVLLAIGAFSMARSPDLTWAQVLLSWTLSDLPATLLLLTFLSRRVRAVGPLILIFMLLALIGSDVLISIVGSRDRYLHAVVEMTSPLGLGGTGTFIAMLVLGFLIFAVWGWIALLWIGRRYQAKKISDESVTVDAVWMLFGLVHSTDLVFGGPLWMFGGLAAFTVYKLLGRLGFWWLGTATSRPQGRSTLLLLRSFSIGSDSERLFDIVGRYWRRIGSIQMIAGVDLDRKSVV